MKGVAMDSNPKREASSMDASDRSPSKRRRTQTLDSAIAAKGKEKMVDPAAAVDDPGTEETCGICLSNGRAPIRGRIDSCEHFFCFVCIMEWAKLESRCPMCKRRFGSIRRPPLPGLVPCERVVQVPVRDQVNDTRLSDPYENVNCSICGSSVDESLLLLCDLCDSAAHTYCVGLGATVPEGDWYCLDCTISRNEHSKSQSDAVCCNQNSNRNLVEVGISELLLVSNTEIASDGIASELSQNFPTKECPGGDRQPSPNTSRGNMFSVLHTEESSIPTTIAGRTVSSRRQPVGKTHETSVSIMEIVSDRISSLSQDSSTIQEQRNDNRLPLRNTSRKKPQGSILHRGESSLGISAGKTISSIRGVADKGARTLHRCRNLQGRIRTLRENWNALQTGSLNFSSSSSNSIGVVYDMKHKGNENKSRLSDFSLNNGKNIRANANVSSEKHIRTGSRDVNKAWKMMEIAKSVQENQRGTGSNHSRNSYYKTNVSKGDENLHPSSFSKDNISGSTVSRNTDFDDSKSLSLRTEHDKHEFLIFEQQKSDDKTTEKDGLASQKLLHSLSISFDKLDSQADPCLAGGSLRGVSGLSFTRPVEFSCSKATHHKGNQDAYENADKSSIRNHKENSRAKSTNMGGGPIIRGAASSSAKDEVQSLVKLNLKLLRRDQHLGAEQFKAVARIATHTILAACGLEHSKSSARPIASSICTHSEQAKLIRRSNLMPNSCRECFYAFVKTVVDSALSEQNL